MILGGRGVSQMMTRGEKIDFVCSNRSQMMTVEGGRGVSQIMTVDDLGGWGFAY